MRTTAKRRSHKGLFCITRMLGRREPAAIKPWLHSTGSLSQEIAAHYGFFAVHCVKKSIVRGNPLNQISPLQHSVSHFNPNRQHALKRQQRHGYYWRREVLLYGQVNQAPIVQAVTLVPIRALSGRLRQLNSLRSQSLGSLLFARGKLSGNRQLYQANNLWTRANCYHWRQQHIWVFETFLSDFTPNPNPNLAK